MILFCEQARASMRERVRSATKLQGTMVAILRCCLVLRVAAAVDALLVIAFVVGGGVIVCFLDVLMCCDADALRCGRGLFMVDKVAENMFTNNCHELSRTSGSCCVTNCTCQRSER